MNGELRPGPAGGGSCNTDNELANSADRSQKPPFSPCLGGALLACNAVDFLLSVGA